MEFGFCGKPDQMKQAAEAGFDYLEMPVSFLAGLTEEEFEMVRGKAKEANLPTPSFNVLFPGSIRLLDPSLTRETLLEYLDPALSRVQRLDGRIVVFGSGGSRRRPEGMPFDETFRRLTEVTRWIGDCAEKHGLTVAIEPLNRAETNMINSVGEGACLRAAANHPRVNLLADYYHIAREGEPAGDLERLGGIVHAHIAASETRRAPLEKEDGLRQMFAAMKMTGYQGRISVEGGCDLPAEGAASVRMLRELWEET